MLEAGQTDFAIQSLEEQKLAAENAGLTGDARGAEALIELVKTNPEAAKTSAGLMLASTMGADEFASVYSKIKQSAEAQFKVMTPEERKDFGLDPNKVYQIGPNGNITTISGIGGAEEFGPISTDFVRRTVGGKTYMEPVPGSPAEAKAKALVAKKAQASTLESRKTNIVIEDIGRLKDKIENAPWYSPVTGIFGAILGKFPETRRVDAENLGETIRANIGFDRLQQMREASPTGGALGQVSDRELKTLQSVSGSIDLSQSETELIKNLDRLNDIYGVIQKRIKDSGFDPITLEPIGVAPTAPIAQQGVAPIEPTPPPAPPTVTPAADLSALSDEELVAEIARLQGTP
jgi:hypothetical protein